jgi:uncharacterized protein YfiM (DUF2279 family)
MIVRCSAIGKLMTAPRNKSELLSETAKTYIQDYFKEKELGIAKEFWSRYTDKGLQMEDEAIEFAGQVLGWDFVVKNTERYNNEWLTGEPDVITKDLLADIKCSWDANTFPMFDTDLKNKDYVWQLQGYMFLTGMDKAELVYCLMNTPHQIVEDEVRRAHWKAGLIDEDLDLREAVQSQHNFNHLPNELRIKRFIVEKDEKAIEQIKEKVEIARDYYETLKSIL